MTGTAVNLIRLFQEVAKALSANQGALNRADTHDHDHGDNMVEVFDTVAEAMNAKKGASPSDQLAYASQLLRQRESGSAKYYAGSLAQAAQKFAGQKVTSDNAMQLLQLLLAGGPPVSPALATPAGQGELIGWLLSRLGRSGAGVTTPAGQAPGIDVASLLTAGLSSLNAKQGGATDPNALLGALMTVTQGGNTPYRAQSGAVIANALMLALGATPKKA